MKKEIERKFLLKKLPIRPLSLGENFEIQHIIQYYYLVGEIWYRIRKIDSNLFGSSYLHTIKTYKDGITYEEEMNYDNSQYRELMEEIHSGKYQSTFITKTRYIFNTGVNADFEGEIKNIKWEIDVFNFELVIAEIEVPYLDYAFEIPDFIKNNIIIEVTGIKEFSNKNLSEELKLAYETIR